MSEMGHMVLEVDYSGVRSGIHGSRCRLYWCQKWDMVLEVDCIGVRSGIHGSGDRLYWCQKWDTG